jgi:uncharacterized protein
MTTTIYVTSTQHFSGKSAVCMGLLTYYQKRGKRIGYMKPISTVPRITGETSLIDEDARFAKEHFSLSEDVFSLAPVALIPRIISDILAGRSADLKQAILSSFESIAKDKDVVVMEGGASLREGWIANLAPSQIGELLNAKDLIVIPFIDELQIVDDLITAQKRLGDRLVGAVINNVPPPKLHFINNEVMPYMEKNQLPILAVLPKEALLQSISVNELARFLNGELLCTGPEGGEELVENMMVGAMQVDKSLQFFRRKANKAVITGGDRPDIQLAAIETNSRCLILTGAYQPDPIIVGRAQEAGVAIIITNLDTINAVEVIQEHFGKTRFHQKQKIDRFLEIFDQAMEYKRFSHLVGI